MKKYRKDIGTKSVRNMGAVKHALYLFWSQTSAPYVYCNGHETLTPKVLGVTSPLVCVKWTPAFNDYTIYYILKLSYILIV